MAEWMGKEIKSIPEEWKNFLLNNKIEWKYIPPYSPHHGGVWERMVKSVKDLLYKAIKIKMLTLDKFTTFLTEVEAILNSKPLCSISDDVDSIEALTPAHFLLGRQLNTLALPPPPPTINNSLKVSQAIQAQRSFFGNAGLMNI